MTERVWQPIETAPKDGVFLTWSPEHGVRDVVSVKGFIAFRGDMYSIRRTTMSHWMPLPQPPANDNPNGKEPKND